MWNWLILSLRQCSCSLFDVFAFPPKEMAEFRTETQLRDLPRIAYPKSGWRRRWRPGHLRRAEHK